MLKKLLVKSILLVLYIIHSTVLIYASNTHNVNELKYLDDIIEYEPGLFSKEYDEIIENTEQKYLYYYNIFDRRVYRLDTQDISKTEMVSSMTFDNSFQNGFFVDRDYPGKDETLKTYGKDNLDLFHHSVDGIYRYNIKDDKKIPVYMNKTLKDIRTDKLEEYHLISMESYYPTDEYVYILEVEEKFRAKKTFSHRTPEGMPWYKFDVQEDSQYAKLIRVDYNGKNRQVILDFKDLKNYENIDIPFNRIIYENDNNLYMRIYFKNQAEKYYRINIDKKEVSEMFNGDADILEILKSNRYQFKDNYLYYGKTFGTYEEIYKCDLKTYSKEKIAVLNNVKKTAYKNGLFETPIFDNYFVINKDNTSIFLSLDGKKALKTYYIQNYRRYSVYSNTGSTFNPVEKITFYDNYKNTKNTLHYTLIREYDSVYNSAVINSNKIEFKYGYVLNGKVLVPISEIKDLLDIDISWDNKTKQLTIKDKSTNNILVAPVGKDYFYINNKKIIKKETSFNPNGTIYFSTDILREFLNKDIYSYPLYVESR